MTSGPRARKARAALAAASRLATRSAIVGALVAVGGWTVWAHLLPWVQGHDYFRLRSIRISSDETRVAADSLAEVSGLYGDTSLWDVRPASIEATLRDASWVKQAEVSRHFPWQVSLSVTRRRGVAAAVADGKAWLVDADGVLFREVDDAGAPDLPYLSGWDEAPVQVEKAARLRTLVSLLDAAADHSVEVSELHMEADGTVWLYAAGLKASVRLGKAARAARGLDRMATALATLGPLADRARLIDVDYEDRIVIRGADDKLPVMMAAQAEKGLALRKGAGEAPATEGATDPGRGGTGTRPSLGEDGRKAERHG